MSFSFDFLFRRTSSFESARLKSERVDKPGIETRVRNAASAKRRSKPRWLAEVPLLALASGALSLAWITISSTGCGSAGSKSTTTFTSPDGRVSISAPAGWEKYTFTNKLAKIGIRNADQHGWGEVIIESKSDLKDGLTLPG